MIPTSIPPLVCAGLFFGVSVLVALKRPWTGASLGFLIFCAGTVWWQGWEAVLFNVSNPRWADTIARIYYSGVVFLPIGLYHFTLEILAPGKHKNRIFGHYSFSTLFLFLLWGSNLLVSGVREFSWGKEPKAGPFHFLFILYVLFLCVQCIYYPYQELKKSDPKSLRASQLRFIILMNSIYPMASVDFLIKYGVPVYPFGVLFILITCFFVTLAITKYSLFDLPSGLRQSGVSIISALLLSLPGIGLLFLLKPLWLFPWVLFGSTFLGAAWHSRVSGFLSAAVDRWPVFQERNEAFLRIKEQEIPLQKAETLEEFCRALSRAVSMVLRTNPAPIFLWEESKKLYLNPETPQESTLSMTSPLPKALEKNPLLVRELIKGALPATEVDPVQAQMTALNIEAALPLHNDEGKTLSILCAGPKTFGHFKELDLAALWHLARVAEDHLKKLLSREATVLKERLAAIGEMASVVSHELKTPLAVIRNSTTFLSGRLSHFSDATVFQKHLGIIGSQTDTLQKLISGILDYTRNRTLRLESVDLNLLLEKMTEVIFIPSGIQFQKDLCPQSPRLRGDPQELGQAVMNLINNAMEAMPHGGRLKLRTETQPGQIVVEVQDTGGGIPTEHFGKIFDPFFTTKSVGSGLGLAVVKKIVERHHGSVSVHSDPGKGTTFSLSFSRTP